MITANVYNAFELYANITHNMSNEWYSCKCVRYMCAHCAQMAGVQQRQQQQSHIGDSLGIAIN